jgi:hypothetical protein
MLKFIYRLYVTLTVNNYMIWSLLYHEEPHPSEIFFDLKSKLWKWPKFPTKNVFSLVIRGGFREGRAGRAPPKIRKACYPTLIKQFNKQLFHEWLTRDL